METIQHNGYSINIEQDNFASNPLEEFDTCPAMVFSNGSREIETYNNCPNLYDMVQLIPDSKLTRGERVPLIKRLGLKVKDIASISDTLRNAIYHALVDIVYATDCVKYWGDADTHMEMLKSLASEAGLSCYFDQSNGYSQGDSLFILAIATPEWAKEQGIDASDCAESLKASCDAYCAWAWGDCYQIDSVTSPEGIEIEDATCCGFYGDDHEKSGLLNHAKGAIQAHEEASKREAVEREEMASRDIVTQ